MDQLEHYGIKGMKWGVRRTPEQLGHVSPKNKPYRKTPRKLVEKGVTLKRDLASDVLGKKISKSQAIPRNQSSGMMRLSKGSKVQHISGIPFEKLRPGQLFVTADRSDNAMYEAYLGAKLKRAGFNPQKVVMELKTDLKAPSSKDQYKIFDAFLAEHKSQIEADVKDWLRVKGKEQDAAKNSRDLYDQFINSVERPSVSQRQFYASLRDNGYNAVLDEHDITGSWMQSQRPLIIMDTMNTIGSFKVSELNTDSMRNALDELLKE